MVTRWPYMRGEPPPQTGIIFWRAGPLWYRLPLLGKCPRSPSLSAPAGVVRGCIWLQWNLSEVSLNAFSHFMMGDLWAHLPTPRWVFSSFWPKPAWPPCPTLSIHPVSPRVTFFSFVSLDAKSPHREMFCQCGTKNGRKQKGETKNGRSTKRH